MALPYTHNPQLSRDWKHFINKATSFSLYTDRTFRFIQYHFLIISSQPHCCTTGYFLLSWKMPEMWKHTFGTYQEGKKGVVNSYMGPTTYMPQGSIRLTLWPTSYSENLQVFNKYSQNDNEGAAQDNARFGLSWENYPYVDNLFSKSCKLKKKFNFEVVPFLEVPPSKSRDSCVMWPNKNIPEQFWFHRIVLDQGWMKCHVRPY